MSTYCASYGGTVYSDNLAQCSDPTCGRRFDCDDEPYHMVFGEHVCRQCISMCEGCGNWIDDDLIAPEWDSANWTEGPFVVRFREWANDGKLTKAHCAPCAADSIIRTLTGASGFTAEDYADKISIARLLSVARALPVRHSLPMFSPDSDYSEIKRKNYARS